MRRVAIVLAMAVIAGCARRTSESVVNFGMWTGDDHLNRYFQTAIVPALQTKFGISLRIVPCADTVELVNKLLNERAQGKTSGGSIDMIWINGENFRTAKQARVLRGPFASKLFNVQFYDPEIRKRDFGTPIEDYEAPWHKAQFVFAYDTARVKQPPRSVNGLRDWIKSHPGRFTYIAPPDFTGSAFVRHILLSYGGGAEPFQRGFSEDLYAKAAAETIQYLNEIKPYLWRRGETYPPTTKELNRLFANQEVDFAMSYGPNFASAAIDRGEFPPTVRTFVFDDGSIGNYNFLAVPFNASNLQGAHTVINQFMSFDQLLDMSRVLGDTFPLRLDLLTAKQRKLVEALPARVATLPISELDAHFIPEPDAGYLTRLEKDWQEKVLRQ